MKEELKITGKGTLHGKEFGTIKISDEVFDKFYQNDSFKEYITSENVKIKKIVYDPELKQYCVDGQWVIPFYNDSKIESLLYKTIEEIKELKEFFVKNQKFETSAKTRDIEKTLIYIKEEVSKLEEMRLKC